MNLVYPGDMNADDIVTRLRTILNEQKKLGCFLLHPEDIETLKGSPLFDAEMTNSRYQVRGHIWEVAVRESNYEKGYIGYEVFPFSMTEVTPTPVLPWYEAILLEPNRDRALDQIFARLDNLLTWQLYDKCDRELRLVDIDKVQDGSLLVTLLSAARPKGQKLSCWHELVQKVEARLLVLKGGDQEKVDKILRGLRVPSEGEATITELAAALRGQVVALPEPLDS